MSMDLMIWLMIQIWIKKVLLGPERDPTKIGRVRFQLWRSLQLMRKGSIEYELSQKEIYLEKVKRIGSMGLPDGGGLRATAWKVHGFYCWIILFALLFSEFYFYLMGVLCRFWSSSLLLGYLSPSHDLWEKELTENRQKYGKLKEELLLSPSEYTRVKEDAMISAELSGERDDAGPLKRQGISHGDHPLSMVKASAWHHYFKHIEIAEQIDRDLLRTHPDLKFFSGESSFSKKNREAMRSILLLFAKLNPAIRYVQGMNEVLAPIFYVFSTDTDVKNAVNAEADSFFCFVRLLSDSVDHFCQQLDNSPVGILSTLSRLAELLKENDEELWKHLEFTTKVKPQFYAFRWITLLLTQEFDFQSILRIWDSLLSNPFGIQDMLLRICCAMLLCMKSRLLSGDFAANLRLLQHYPDINIEHLLRVAQDLSADTSSYSLSL